MILEYILIAIGLVNLIISVVILIKLKNSDNTHSSKPDKGGICICSRCQKSYPSSQKKCPWCGGK
ncbi:MAG: hypothetical protein K2G36_09825 [Ruminococcus sp.]|nr:hypothetical protein [Ruminococcus sp.]